MSTEDLAAEDLQVMLHRIDVLLGKIRDVAKDLEQARLEGARLDVSSAAAEEEADQAQKLLQAVH